MTLDAVRVTFFYCRNHPSRFYGTFKHVNIIHGDGDLYSNNEDYFEPKSIPQPENGIIAESESNCSYDEDVPLIHLQTTFTSKEKRKKTKGYTMRSLYRTITTNMTNY